MNNNGTVTNVARERNLVIKLVHTPLIIPANLAFISLVIHTRARARPPTFPNLSPATRYLELDGTILWSLFIRASPYFLDRNASAARYAIWYAEREKKKNGRGNYKNNDDDWAFREFSSGRITSRKKKSRSQLATVIARCCYYSRENRSFFFFLFFSSHRVLFYKGEVLW